LSARRRPPAPTGPRDDGRVGFEYFVLRCVPRVDREEFVNVGVVLFSPDPGYLAAACEVDPERIRALSPAVDLADVRAALATIEAICRGDAGAGAAARGLAKDRFRWLAAPRSTVVQPGPVHAGLTTDPQRELARLLSCLVGESGQPATG
jgi:hypothetical protein